MFGEKCSYAFWLALQTAEECASIKEKVKSFIAAWNVREGAAGSGSGNADCHAPNQGLDETAAARL